ASIPENFSSWICACCVVILFFFNLHEILRSVDFEAFIRKGNFIYLVVFLLNRKFFSRVSERIYRWVVVRSRIRQPMHRCNHYPLGTHAVKTQRREAWFPQRFPRSRRR
uniref:Uncharacterized protein n=1 Tax=Parascaris univalens TaxID=6257 RepID=A0A915A2E7_PARUN